MIQVAVIGSGAIAETHIQALQQCDCARLCAVVARNPKTGGELARRYGVAYYPDLTAAKQAEDIQAVIICTPTYTHEAFTVEAARLKCHVLCEKPAALNVAAFDRMADACTEYGVRFMVAQVVRWHPEYSAIRSMIAAGKLGNIHMVYIKRLGNHPADAHWYRDPALSGGGVYDINVHDIDFLYYLFGKPETVYANGWKNKTGCWNHVCTSLVWAGGARAVAETSLETTGDFPFSYEFRATGDAGTISFVSGENARLMWYPDGNDPEQITVEPADMYALQVQEFFSAVQNGKTTRVPDADVRGVLNVIAASVESLEKNKLVKL